MRGLFFLLTLLVSLVLTEAHGQQLNVENVFNSSSTNNTQHGINAAYMFHHVLNDEYQLTPEMEAVLIDNNFDVVRFPGGAIGNYYRFNGPGYGARKNEVENVANTVNCNGDGLYCFEKDEFAPRNFIYDFMELMDSKYTVTGRPTGVLYMLNLLLHFVYNYGELPELETIDNLAELEDALNQEIISQGFYDRIIENYSAIELIVQNPNMELAGIEMGNEFYFYQEVTTFPYPPTNSNPFFNLNSALNTIHPRIDRYLILINFYKRLVQAIDPDVKIGVPTGGINHFGNQTNADLLWNTAMKQWVIQDVDALIPHLYVKTVAPDTDQPVVAQDDDNSDLIEIKQALEETIETKFLGTLEHIVEFFALDSDFRELWMTEYNVNKNNSSTQIWDDWPNTYLHGVFLHQIMARMTASDYASYLKYSIQHAWSGGDGAFSHCMVSRNNDGTTINRISHHNNEDSEYLKSQNTSKLNGTITHTQNSWDFYTDAYYSYDSGTAECPTEFLILSFSNLRSDVVAVNFNFTGNQATVDGKVYNVISSRLSGFKGQNVSSGAGRTVYDPSDTDYNIETVDDEVDISGPVNIPSYTTGHIKIIIEPVNLDCVINGILDNEFSQHSLKVYPSPAKSFLQIELPAGTTNSSSTLSITNTMGQLIRYVETDEDHTSIDVHSLDSGIYFIHLDQDGKRSRAVPFFKM